jgi:hypothetical protein
MQNGFSNCGKRTTIGGPNILYRFSALIKNLNIINNKKIKKEIEHKQPVFE